MIKRLKKGQVECYCYMYGTKQLVDGKERYIAKGKIPLYATKEAACADIFIPEETIVPANKAIKIDLWIAFEIAKGYKIIMYPRSSLLINKHLIQPVSIIDSDYSGRRVFLPLFNPTNEDIKLEAGERVAQIECTLAYDCVDWYRSNVERTGGGGSTGK